MNKYGVGTELKIRDKTYTVCGYIVYKNPDDGCSWIDYRLKCGGREFWLSVDVAYNEYSLSRPANTGGNIGPEWKKVDEGTQIVTECAGNVDVDPGERAEFVEYEDEAEEKTLSMEIWEDGTEVSQGYYLNREDVQVTKRADAISHKSKRPQKSDFMKRLLPILCVLLIVACKVYFFGEENDGIKEYLKESTSKYQYVTSITGQHKQKAQVYEALRASGTDGVTRDIIDGVNGETENISQNSENTADQSISIVTKNEYALVYIPEDAPDKVYIQVSDRKYNYSSNQAPYRASVRTGSWYRSHYYSSSYKADAQRFKNIPSSYQMYNGPIVHDLGNGYFDSYASSIRQTHINTRKSSGGGLSFGK